MSYHQTIDRDSESVKGVVQRLYNAVLRKRLPRKYGVLNGVTARWPRLLDQNDRNPEHEAELIGLATEFVDTGDSVQLLGGGYGVTAVYLARELGDEGQLTIWEASGEMAHIVQETLELNLNTKLRDRVTVIHAAIGPVYTAFGQLGNPEQIAASDLPVGDAWVVDIEGAELELLAEADDYPPTLVMETHADHLDLNYALRLVREKGYEVQDWRDTPHDGIHVFAATQEDNNE